jgi:hypothetical protein
VDPNNRAPRSPISASVLHQVLQRMPAAPDMLPPGKCICSFQVNTKKLGVLSEELQKVGLTLFTPGITPQLKRVEEWVNSDLVQKLGVSLVQVCIMGQSTFLIVLECEESRHRVLARTPLLMRSCMVLVQAYDPASDLTSLHYKSTAIWVDLVNRDPIREIEALQMLERVGLVILSPLTSARSRFENIRGCVFADLTADLVKGIEIHDGYGNKGVVKVIYQNLPLICYIYKVQGHLPQMCPTRLSHASAKGNRKVQQSTEQPCYALGSNSVPIGARQGKDIPPEVQHCQASANSADIELQAVHVFNAKTRSPPDKLVKEEQELIKSAFITSPVQNTHSEESHSWQCRGTRDTR